MTDDELDNFHQRILSDIENNCLHSRGPIAMTMLYSDIAVALQAMVVRTCRAEEERDAALARVGELNAEWLAAMLRCPCERVATRFSASGTECLRCDDPDCDPGYAHADGTPVTDWLDLSYAALVRAGTGETEKAPDRKT